MPLPSVQVSQSQSQSHKQQTRPPHSHQLSQPLSQAMSQSSTKSVTSTANKAVRWSETQSTIQSGIESFHHYVSYINSKQGSWWVTNSVSHSVRHWVSPPLSQSHKQQTRQSEIIFYPDLLLTKLKAISGQVRKSNFFDWLDCERMNWVLSSAHAIWHEQKKEVEIKK